jgi:DNA-binding protein HU-beta
VSTVAKELKKNGKLGLVGFGTFSVLKRKAREGRNPQTGKAIKIPAKKVVKFKAGKALAEKVK